MVDNKASGASKFPGPVVSNPDEGTATIQQGESNLSEVAKRLGVSEKALKDANPQIKSTKIQARQELKLPGKQQVKTSSSETHAGSNANTLASDARSRAEETKMCSLFSIENDKSRELMTCWLPGIDKWRARNYVEVMSVETERGDL